MTASTKINLDILVVEENLLVLMKAHQNLVDQDMIGKKDSEYLKDVMFRISNKVRSHHRQAEKDLAKQIKLAKRELKNTQQSSYNGGAGSISTSQQNNVQGE